MQSVSHYGNSGSNGRASLHDGLLLVLPLPLSWRAVFSDLSWHPLWIGMFMLSSLLPWFFHSSFPIYAPTHRVASSSLQLLPSLFLTPPFAPALLFSSPFHPHVAFPSFAAPFPPPWLVDLCCHALALHPSSHDWFPCAFVVQLLICWVSVKVSSCPTPAALSASRLGAWPGSAFACGAGGWAGRHSGLSHMARAHGVVASHPLRMRKALGSNPSVSILVA
jgi:hypothetical protein